MTFTVPVEIPSPTTGVWWLGPVPLRAYAMCILAGIFFAAWSTRRRLQASTGQGEVVFDIAAWAVPFGIVGARIYHVITTPQPYFGEGGNPWHALRIWEGGLGIWGAVAFGALGAWIGCRRHGVALMAFGDALAPGLFVAQAMGRFGNYFNNEIYGPPTDLPWALRVYVWDQAAGHAVTDPEGNPIVKGLYHPTFLYEALWCLLMAALLVWLERHRDLRQGQLFALVLVGYTAGRLPIELLRTDEANRILGLRVNVWVSVFVFLLGVWLFLRAGRRRPVAGPDRPGPDPGGTSEEPGEPEEASGPGPQTQPVSQNME